MGPASVLGRPLGRGLALFFAVAFFTGAGLRLAWLEDMEWKGDEQYMFERSQRVGLEEPWPTLGMTSGAGLRNPGLSISLFAALARATGASTPLGLNGVVVGMNLLAFVLLAFLALRIVPLAEREAWLWAGALAAVSPIAVLAHRKIWAQSVLAPFCVLFLIAWYRRDRRWGAALLGLLGAVLGQIHMTGFLFAAGFVLWELVFARGPGGARPRTRWLPWLGGSVVGAVPLVPWLEYVLTTRDRSAPWRLETVGELAFFRHWTSDALGLGLDYSLGARYLEFLRWPVLGGRVELYPTLYLHGLSLAVGLVIALSALRATWRARRRWASPRGLLGVVRAAPDAGFTVAAAFFGYGLLLTLAGLVVWRHYLYVTFPLEWLSLALLALAYAAPHARRLLALAWVLQLAITLSFLTFIHAHGGAVGGDYGRAYRAQPR